MDLSDLLRRDQPQLAIDEAYLNRLKSLPQSLVSGEVEGLDQSLQRVETAVADLGINHSSDFIATTTTFTQLDNLTEELASLSQTAADDARKVPLPPARAYTASQQIVSQELALYKEIDKVQDLLQLPELVKSCVSEGYYAAALDLAGLAQRMKGRYPHLKVVAALAASVEESIKSMTALLMRLLSESPRLPTLIKAVSFLRRVEPFRSPTARNQLELLFVAARKQYLQSQWETLESSEIPPGLFLKSYVELFREHVFATVTSYTTIFGGSSDYVAQFLRHVVKDLSDMLDKQAPKLSASERQSLFLQLAYCSHSLGRVGAEFWPLLACKTISTREWADAYSSQQDMAKTAAASLPPRAGQSTATV